MSHSNKSINASGFALIEVIAATLVMTLGLFAAATFTGGSKTPGRRSKYVTLASSLATNKLQDLSRWDGNDPNVCVPANSKSCGEPCQGCDPDNHVSGRGCRYCKLLRRRHINLYC